MNKHKRNKLVNGEKRCIMSNKLINGNGKEAVLCKHAVDYVKKLGFEVQFIRKVRVTAMLLIMVFMISFTTAQFTFNDDTLPTLNPINATVTPQVTGNGTFNQTLTDLIYKRLDSGNDVLTSADWNYQLFDLRNVSVISGANNALLILQASSQVRLANGDLSLQGGVGDMESNTVEFLTTLSTDKIYASFVLGNGGMVWETSGGEDFIIRTPASSNAGIFFNSTRNNSRLRWRGATDILEYDKSFTVAENIEVNGNLTSSDGRINVPIANNITFGGISSCLDWQDTIGFVTNICYIGAGTFQLFGNTVRIDFDTISMGKGDSNQVVFSMDTGGSSGGTLAYENGTGIFEARGWQMSNSLFTPTFHGSQLSELLGGNFSWQSSGDNLFFDVDTVTIDRDVTLNTIPLMASNATTDFLCITKSGVVFKNETGC